MASKELWQKDNIVKATGVLKSFANVRAVILKGSFNDSGVNKDWWSDIDFVIILNDNSADKFLDQTEWLAPLGQIFAVDQVITDNEMTLRVCLDGYRRFDFTFINSANAAQIDFSSDSYKILYSKSGDLDSYLSSTSSKKGLATPSDREIDQFINKFWFTGVIAIGKMARKDYLVGSHLALEMAQNCIVLQMMMRDEAKGTNIHRVGESEEVEIFAELTRGENGYSLPEKIVGLIDDSAQAFDKLATNYFPEYSERYPIFETWVNDLRKTI